MDENANGLLERKKQAIEFAAFLNALTVQTQAQVCLYMRFQNALYFGSSGVISFVFVKMYLKMLWRAVNTSHLKPVCCSESNYYLNARWLLYTLYPNCYKTWSRHLRRQGFDYQNPPRSSFERPSSAHVNVQQGESNASQMDSRNLPRLPTVPEQRAKLNRARSSIANDVTNVPECSVTGRPPSVHVNVQCGESNASQMDSRNLPLMPTVSEQRVTFIRTETWIANDVTNVPECSVTGRPPSAHVNVQCEESNASEMDSRNLPLLPTVSEQRVAFIRAESCIVNDVTSVSERSVTGRPPLPM